jgi:hypothetical protein
MKDTRLWAAFILCSIGWLAASLCLAPHMSGTDVYIFRDAGWNLAASGSFKSAALPYSVDLTPHLYSHYTPLMPLLFAGYASIFPRNAYTGTVFNLLVGLVSAALVLQCVLWLPAGRLRDAAAFAVAILPVIFVTYDRPEAIALVLFCVTIAYASRPGAHPVLAGCLIALTFLAHPFGAISAALWVSSLFLLRNWKREDCWWRTVVEVSVTAISTLIPIALVALLFYALDHDSLVRFAAHSLGRSSGLRLHSDKPSGWLQGVRHSAFGLSALKAFTYFASLSTILLLLAWAVTNRRKLGHAEWIPIAASVGCALISVRLFPFQAAYVYLIVLLVPAALLILTRRGSQLAVPGLVLLLYAVLIRLPSIGLDWIESIEQIPSYRAAQVQPAFLRAQLSSPEGVLAVEGGSYDLFKPEFSRMIELEYVEDKDRYRALAAVANCYDSYHGTADALRPLPDKLDAANFRLIQRDPQHAWITLLGHRLMRAQWGYGCDLYVRNTPQPANAASTSP